MSWQGPLRLWFEARLRILREGTDKGSLYHDLLQEIEPVVVDMALEHCQQNQTAAAKLRDRARDGAALWRNPTRWTGSPPPLRVRV